jgi:tetratricopeptide repeat protein
VILAYAGRRAQSLAGDPELVGKRIRRLLVGLRPSAVVGAAADGGDLLTLEAALEIPDGPAVHVVLPTAREVFREDSVDPGWRDRFDRVLGEVERRGGSIESLGLEAGEAAYRRGNQAFLDRAAFLAGDAERSVVLVVAREGEGAMVTDLLERARVSGVPALRIDPSVHIPSRPRCFIAMPFGRKTDAQRKIELDCNRVYEKILVPALESAQLYYRRADEEIDSGIVLEPMIEWLAEADLVIGDLETGNFNVGWELGLRHLMRAGQTLLMGPVGTTAPFDVAALRAVRYRHDEAGVTDDAAIEAWQTLAPFLARVDGPPRNDSPVGTVMEVQQWGMVRRRTARDERWEARRQELALARDLRDADLMLAVLDDLQGFAEDQIRLLRAETGVGLVRLGRFADAQHLLREIVEADPAVLRPEAHVYYAQSLYRPKGASADALHEAERVLKRVLVKRQGHPEVRALLGAVAKRRMLHREDAAARKPDLDLALKSYRYDFEHNLNLYYEGINVVAIGVALALGYGDEAARAHARELLPAVRVAARLALNKPDERFWAAATLAECTLHEHLLGLAEQPDAVHAAYRWAGAERPPEGYLDSALWQLDFLRTIGVPEVPLAEARTGLLEGAGRAVSGVS